MTFVRNCLLASLAILLTETVFAQGYQPEFGLGAYQQGVNQANQQKMMELQLIQQQLQILRQAEQMKQEKEAREAELAAREAAEQERQAKLKELLSNPPKMHEAAIKALQGNQGNIAQQLFERAANMGYTPSQLALGLIHESGALSGTPNHRIAFDWYKKAANTGNPEGLYKVGSYLLSTDKGIARDERTGIDYLTKSATTGHLEAQTGLALAYFNGSGVKKDWKESLGWALKAGYQGNAVAQATCGYIYSKGYPGLKPNKKEAEEWLAKSAAQGNRQAQEMLVNLKQGKKEILTQALN